MFTISLSFSLETILSVSTSSSKDLIFDRHAASWLRIRLCSKSLSPCYYVRFSIYSSSRLMCYFCSWLPSTFSLSLSVKLWFFLLCKILSDRPSMTPAISFSIMSCCRNLQYSKSTCLCVERTSWSFCTVINLVICVLNISNDLFYGSWLKRASFKISEASTCSEIPWRKGPMRAPTAFCWMSLTPSKSFVSCSNFKQFSLFFPIFLLSYDLKSSL